MGGASIFVPTFVPNNSFGLGAPPPPPPAALKPPKSDEDGKENFDANRTSLKATSKPFQPQGMVTFNPHEYTWTVDVSKSGEKLDGSKRGDGKKAKGKGKDNEHDNGKSTENGSGGNGKAKAK